MILYCILIYFTVLYYKVLYCRFCIKLYSKVLSVFIVFYYTCTLHCTALYIILLYNVEWPQFFEFGLCSLSVLCLFVVGKFSPFHSFHFVSFISNSNIFAVNLRVNAVYGGPLHPALHGNGGCPAPPGVT